MAEILFLLDADRSKTLVNTLVELDLALIDMAKVRRRYTGSYRSDDRDKLICKVFADKLRRIPARVNVVVNSYPRTERQVSSVLRLLGQGFKPVFVVSGRTPRHQKELLKKNFPGRVKNRKVAFPP